MHQRHPIKVDKGRAFSAKDGPVSSSTQVSFHKIYRQKRCYSLVDKEKEGRGSSQWRGSSMSLQRDNNTGSRHNYTSGSSSRKPSRRIDSTKNNSYSSYSVSPPYRDCDKNYRQHLKRHNDRLGCKSLSGPEFDVPFVKKQKVENDTFRALQAVISSETGPDKQKMVLEDTKWMYKNQHAKMSGPYSVKQLMEGLHARFLQDDLLVYQFHEGKLCRPITLKQLIDDLESCNSLMLNPVRHFNQSCSEEAFGQVCSPCNNVEDLDLPPGFGGCSVQNSERPSGIRMPTSAAPSKRYVGSSPSLPDFGVAEFSVPPGFEAVASAALLTEPHVSELQGSSRRLSTGAGLAVRSEGTEGMRGSYEEFEPVVYGQGHSSCQGSSPHSKISFMTQGAKSLRGNLMQLEPIGHGRGHSCQQGSSPPLRVNFTAQGTRNLNENLRRHTNWGFSSPNTRASNIESQMISSPTVCIGLPVGKLAVQNWPFGNNLPIAHTQDDNGLLQKEHCEFPVTYDPTPLALIQLELLAAVKRSYITTVLSALIDEQLKTWIDGKDTMVKSLLPEDGSRSREASSLSSAEFSAMCVESETFQNGASTSPAKHDNGLEETSLQMRAGENSDGSRLNVHVGSTEASSELRAAQCFDDSGSNNRSICIGVYQGPFVEACSMRNADNPHTPFTLTDMTVTEQNSLNGTSKVPFTRKNANQDANKAELSFACDQDSKLCVNSSSFMGGGIDDCKELIMDQKQEVQHRSGDEIPHGQRAFVGDVQSSGDTYDAVLLETEPSFLVSGKKTWKIKSLKHLMQMTGKLQPRHSRTSSAVNKKGEMTIGMVPEASSLQNGVLIPYGYDGCARTSFDGWAWHKLDRCTSHSESFERGRSTFCTQLNALTAPTHHTRLRKLSAAADSSFIVKLTQSERKLKLARSKIHEWGVFAVESVKAGEFIIEYVGEVLRPRVSDIRERQYRNLGIGSSFLFRVDDEMVVDATKQGGPARFMNYSCDPNCCAKIVTVKGTKKVYFYAKRRITAGEELTYECKSRLEAQKIPCNCGSAMCRGSSLRDLSNS